MLTADRSPRCDKKPPKAGIFPVAGDGDRRLSNREGGVRCWRIPGRDLLAAAVLHRFLLKRVDQRLLSTLETVEVLSD